MSETINESRRGLLRLALAVPVGAVVGSALWPANEYVAGEITERLDVPTGNKGMQDILDETCADAPDRNQCAGDFMNTPDMKKKVIAGAPILEEMTFRVIPSVVTDVLAPSPGESRTAAVDHVAVGTGGLTLSRKELIAGAVTTALFGITHNATKDGLDTKNLPAQQFIGGGVLWYLQRKFGILSNLSAHAAYNAWWTNGFRSGRSH